MIDLPLDVGRLLRETFVARVEHLATTESTNDVAKARAAQGDADLPRLIVADAQTAGRGRGSHRWWTGRDSLAFSLLLDAACLGADRQRAMLVGLGAAVAVVETVAPLVPERRVGLHWPNDVFVDGRKLAGILVEVPAGARLVVGIGLNTNDTLGDAPPEVRDKAATLRDLTGRRFDRTSILLDLLPRLEAVWAHLASSPETIGNQAHARCLQRGTILTVELGRESVRGRCGGIAADGALLLDTPGGRRRLVSGVVLWPS
jgi:BirA family biotin operon repressor/biotin-[acetyl-CoA-carboxylase] ligase